jgi:DNA invertase Pin-like site-specific DNA recombinase
MLKDIHYARSAPAHEEVVAGQLAACAALSARDSAVVVGQFVDWGTGLLAQQTGLREAVQLLRSGEADRLVVQRWDCLGRAAGQVGGILQDLMGRGIQIVSCTEGEMDAGVAALVARVGRWEGGDRETPPARRPGRRPS